MTKSPSRDIGEFLTSKYVILALAALALFLLIGFPLIEMMRRSVLSEEGFTLARYVAVFTEPRNLEPFLNTALLSVLTIAGSLCVGVPAAWLVARTDLPARGLVEALFILPYMIPPFIGAIAWIQILSPRIGYANQLWAVTFGSVGGPFDIYSLSGLVFVMVLHAYPFVYLTVRSALDRMDPSLEEAAAMSGASRMQTLRTITWPLVMPGIAAGALLVLVDTIANFGIPALIGMQDRFYVLTTRIYSYINLGDFDGIRSAAALSSTLMFLAGAAVLVNDFWLRRRDHTTMSGKSTTPGVVALQRWRPVVTAALAVFFALFVFAPMIAVVASAFLKAWGLEYKWENLTLDNFHYILFEYDLTRRAITNSLMLAIGAATATTFFGAALAYLSARTQLRGRQVVDVLVTLPHAIPGMVVALSMILAWSGLYGIDFYNTIWIIFVAYVSRYTFFAFRNSVASLAQVHPSLEEAALMSGASWARAFRDIVVPLIRPGLLAGWFLVFMPTLRELTISILLWGPETPTIGVAVFEMQNAGYYTASAAMASLLLAVVLAGDFLLRRLAGARPTG